ncbi:unnamed protein product [Cercospora beticola]|nr:unnamed protein product [Cercospora beticola]
MPADRDFEEGHGSVDKSNYDFRYNSIATSGSGYSKEHHSQVEYAQQGGPHIAIAAAPHPHRDQHDAEAAALHQKLGLRPNEHIQIIDWNGPDDPENPFNWSNAYKWTATLTTCFISILTGIPAGAYGAASNQMSEAWHIDQSGFPYLSFALTTWNIGAAFFPLLFVPLTESTGRMPGYFAAYILFIIWLIPSALSPNFATILITRFFGGGASSVAITIVAGTITDIWKGDRARSTPMAVFGMTSVVGIALGPFVGGAIQSSSTLSWRWIYYIQIIYCVAFLPAFYLILSETRGDVILATRAKKLRKQGHRTAYARSELNKPSLATALKISFLRPTKMLCTEPVVIMFTLWVSFAWGLLFLFQSSVPLVMSAIYPHFTTFQLTLIQLAISAGAIIAWLLNPFQDRLYFSSAGRNTERPGKPIPEARLYTSVPGSLIFGAAMIWFGVSNHPNISFWVPTIALGAFGIGVYSIYLAVTNYLADAYEKYAASALSAAGLGRNALGAFLPLATPAMYNNLGFVTASCLLGGLAIALTLAPLALLWKGEAIRARSPFMLDATLDEGEAEERRESVARRWSEHHGGASMVERKRSSVLPDSRVGTQNFSGV